MNRSRRCVFVSHCILAQAVRAEGLAKYFPAAIKPVIQFCLDHDINIVQMPCPEFACSAGGPGRQPHGKAWYEKNGLRGTASEIAIGQADYMKRMADAGFDILAVIGVEFSPACAVTWLNRGPVIYSDRGIYVEELQDELAKRELRIPFIGVNQRALKKLQRDLNAMLSLQQTAGTSAAPPKPARPGGASDSPRDTLVQLTVSA